MAARPKEPVVVNDPASASAAKPKEEPPVNDEPASASAPKEEPVTVGKSKGKGSNYKAPDPNVTWYV